MKIEWNRVTWYSKILALAIFIAAPFIGFYCGIRYGEALQTVHDIAAAPASDYYENVAAWQTSERSDAGFSLAYPLDFETNDIYTKTPAPDWRFGADESQPGILAFTLIIPAAFDPQTNFRDAKLTVGYSANGTAAARCLVASPVSGPSNASSSATINNMPFVVFRSTDAGAGNYYETTSYRMVRGGKCWAVEYTIHSSQIMNYPASYDLHPFDRAMVTGVLDRIVRTFKFL